MPAFQIDSHFSGNKLDKLSENEYAQFDSRLASRAAIDDGRTFYQLAL